MNNMVIISCILDQSLDQKNVTGTVLIEKLKFQISTIQLNIVLVLFSKFFLSVK